MWDGSTRDGPLSWWVDARGQLQSLGARRDVHVVRHKQPRRPALPDQFAALSLSFQIGGPSTRRKRASAKFSPRATSRAAVVTPDDKETAPAPFSAELTAGAFDDYGDCKQS